MNLDLTVGFNAYAKKLHEHFKIAYSGSPRYLESGYFFHKYNQLQEEMGEIAKAWNMGLLDDTVDGLIDLTVIALGTMEQMGIDIDSAMHEVLKANVAKELGKNPKRGTHDLDLIKPEGWTPPNIDQYCQVDNKGLRGVVVLEGADNMGKTTLAKYMEENFGAYYINHTWSPQLDSKFLEYMTNSFARISHIALRQLVVVDRAWVTHELYGKAYGEYKVNPGVQPLIDSMLKNFGAVNVMCLADDLDKVQELHEASEKDEMYKDNYEVARLYDLLWGAGIKGMRDGKPANSWNNYYKYTIGENGSDMGAFCSDLFSKNPQLRVK